MRCDRVDFPPGGIAYTHTHQGPGIRCLLGGRDPHPGVRCRASRAAGEAWFEAGRIPSSRSRPSATDGRLPA